MRLNKIIGLVLMALALSFPVFTLAQDVATNSPPSAGTNAPVLTPTGNDGVVLGDPTGLLTRLTKQWPWLTVLFGWVVTLRLCAKPFSSWIQSGFDHVLLFVKRTPEKDDDEFVHWVLTTKLYRLLAFVVDWATSIKLPTSDSMEDTASAIAAKNSAKANGMVGLFLICALSLGVGGCVSSERLETGGAYAQTQTSRAMPQLFTLDASFDMACSALDVTFKYERNNRIAIWNLSPNIKHNLDKLRVEASRVKKDYAIARKSYLSNPTPAGLDAVSASLNEFLKLNAAALEVIQSKGVQLQ